MVLVHATILGGLPIVADVWYSGPDYEGEYDAGVDAIYWCKKDGSKGKELSQKMYERLEKYDQWWAACVTEQANDWLAYNAPTKYSDGRVEGEYSEAFILLNGRPHGSR